ncbi:MAG TPA: BTAD domain-containing putative transcriptional regulator, partial [Streptosporangiaceae bacterium]|nr:BTAD domain-containing putative transcriptional regulator [Streptosporangiaceae bacterium]
MEFRVLGPVEVRAAGRRLEVGHAKQASVLAVLLLEPNQVVPPELLIDRVWGDDPPGSVRNALYAYVARLKATIAAAGEPEVKLSRRAGGYVLEVNEEQVDLYRFRRRMEEARTSADDERAAVLLTQALGLWHRVPLAGLASPWFDAMRQSLELQRMAAQLALNDAMLRQGKHTLLISELAGQATDHPANERLIGQLMLALYRSGRQAEALRWYERTRHWLADDLGADPGPELQALHQRMLRTDPALAGPWSAGRDAMPVPRELPADVAAFTGRTAELAELDRLLATGTEPADRGVRRVPSPLVISTIGGTAGVGKTALAVHWAHRVADHFPDGQLYVNLRGYDPGQPMTASDVLAGFLPALGLEARDIPVETEQRSACYRSLLAGRRVLVVLDNASDAEQVRPLLPGTPACAVIVTSRDSLAGLVARDGARRIDLDLLPLRDAVELLRTLIGDRVDADDPAAAALATQCALLPLALRVVAELAAARPATPLSELASELADHQRRLDMLDAGGDLRSAARAVFSWSYQRLGNATARAFRLLALHPGPGFDAYAVAALTGTTLSSANQVLDTLSRAYLVRVVGPGRYGMHDLLRDYARHLTTTHDNDVERQDAQTRLFDHYLHAAAAAMDTLFPAERHLRPRIPASANPVPPVSDPDAAQAWLDGECANLTMIAAHAAGNGWPSHATRLATTVGRYLGVGDRYAEFLTLHACARRAGRRSGDRGAEGTALIGLGIVAQRQGRVEEAVRQLRQARTLCHDAGDRYGEYRALGNLGMVTFHHGDYEESADYFQQALALSRKLSDRAGESKVLAHLGDLDLHQGRYEQATQHLRRSLYLSRETGYLQVAPIALATLGAVSLRLGHSKQATGHLHRALALTREIAHAGPSECDPLCYLADVDLRQGRYPEAASHLRRALAICLESGDRTNQAHSLAMLGA